MGETCCPLCGEALSRCVRLAGVQKPGTAAEQVVFLLTCQNRGCVWEREERVA